ncbi:MAG: D-aminoacyl-tRNA deacylase [Nevskia sp.]|jgi:D-tyrosyl-tRNA(Tyr) deacylase|nr:D-aminoacyl-tRNA deacylase [Nevskia sp.]MCK9384278.1 D-aminoacyl-tRNA deacylase [Nevskia sp.]
MIGLLQRVQRASVLVGGETVAEIGVGLLVFVGIERNDSEAQARRLLERLLGYRIFADAAGRMNRSLRDLGPAHGGLLLVSQFTLAADTRSGARPSFTSAMAPDAAKNLYDFLLREAATAWPSVASGVFGADMQVSLINDGPVTFSLRVE